MKLPTFPYLAKSFIEVLHRFPFVILTAFFGVVVSMIIIEKPHTEEDIYVEMLMASFIALPTLLGAAIISEKWQQTGFKKWLPTIISLALVVCYYFTLDVSNEDPSEEMILRFFGLMLVAHLLVSYLPYLDKTPIEDFWEYNKQLFGNFMVGAFYNLIIFAGLSFAILAIDNLFGIDIDGNIYAHLFVFIAGVINTTYFLFHFPNKYMGLAQEGGAFIKAFKNLSKYILIPIVGIYFLILYAYSIKILGTWELPKGWVSSLVLGFSVAGIFTYLLNYLLVNIDENKLVHGFRKWFFFVLFPMVILLFVAIGTRLSDYGVTEGRYVVALLGAWLMVVSVYFILSKKDNIKFIPISLSILALAAVLGPLSMFQVSEKSQVGRLELLLTNNNLLQNGIAVAPVDPIPAKDAENIQSILNYLRSSDHFATASTWFGVAERPKRSDIDDILQTLRINESIKINVDYSCNIYFQRPLSLELKGYDELVFPNDSKAETLSNTGWDVGYSPGANILELYKDDELADKINMLPYLQMLNGKYDCNSDNYENDDAAYSLSGKEYEIMIITEWLQYDRKDSLKLENWKGVLLIGKKQ